MRHIELFLLRADRAAVENREQIGLPDTLPRNTMQNLKGKTICGGVLQGSVLKARVLSCMWALMVFDSALGPERLWIVGMAAAFTGV